jgi:Reticulon
MEVGWKRASFCVLGAVEDLLLWRNVKHSASVLGGISLVYFILEWTSYNLVSISANIVLLFVAVTFLWSNIASFANK